MAIDGPVERFPALPDLSAAFRARPKHTPGYLKVPRLCVTSEPSTCP